MIRAAEADKKKFFESLVPDANFWRRFAGLNKTIMNNYKPTSLQAYKPTSLHLCVIILMGIVTALFSCAKKEPISPPILQGPQLWTGDTVKKENDYMAFKNRYVFENTIQHLAALNSDSAYSVWESNYSFVSLRSLHENDTTDYEVEDPLLATFLNSDKMVRIGDSLFLIDFVIGRVYVCKSITSTNIANLRNKVYTSGIIDTFNSRHALLWPEDFPNGNGPELRVMACSENGAPDKKDKPNTYRSGAVVVDVKSCYEKAGVYFSVIHKIQHRAQGQGKKSYQATITIESLYNWAWKAKCRDEMTDDFESTQTNVYGKDVRPYHSSRGLHSFNFITDFTWLTNGQQTSETKRTTIQSF